MSVLRLEAFAPDLLEPCSLAVGAAETVTLTGPSGSGKSLFLRAAADLDPHKGEIWLDDKPARHFSAPEWRRQVAYLPAESHWWAPVVSDHFTNEDEALLGALGLPAEAFGWTVSRLSSGERQRLAVARMLSIRPRALLLDEATANLDPANTQRVEQVIRIYQAATGSPVLWVSHDPAQRDRVSRRHLTIRDRHIEEAE